MLKVYALLIFSTLIGCVSEQKCIDKYGWERTHDTIIINKIISKDSLIMVIDSVFTHDTITKENERVKISYWYKDKLVYVQADCKEVAVHDTIVKPKIKKKGFVLTEKMTTNLMWALLIIAFIIFILSNVFKR